LLLHSPNSEVIIRAH